MSVHSLVMASGWRLGRDRGFVSGGRGVEMDGDILSDLFVSLEASNAVLNSILRIIRLILSGR